MNRTQCCEPISLQRMKVRGSFCLGEHIAPLVSSKICLIESFEPSTVSCGYPWSELHGSIFEGMSKRRCALEVCAFKVQAEDVMRISESLQLQAKRVDFVWLMIECDE